MDEQMKDALLRQFRDYLDYEGNEQSPPERIDLFTLFNELAGLKNEVKIESRQLKGALDDFRQAFTALDSNQQELIQIVHTRRESDQQTTWNDSVSITLGLIDLYDRIAAGLSQELPSPSFFGRFIPARQQKQRWLQGYLEGQHMLLGRVLSLLSNCGAVAADAVGKQFDPQLMQAVGSKCDSGRREGEVLEELRKGFLMNQRILRPAEVIVNKREQTI